jgi:hypothetical protein
LDGIDDRKLIGFASSFGSVATKSIGPPFGDWTVAMKSVTVPLDLIIDRISSISLESDSVELRKNSVSGGRFSGDADQFSGSGDRCCAGVLITSVSFAMTSVSGDRF